ncbi:MAG: EAL domain-containing protein [Oxalobacter sp.]|nr:EAL domain-containing protein [Oxalobacter sp.]
MVSSASTTTEDVYLGRQPILDRNQSLYAFELLFRAGRENHADIIDNIAATSAVIAHTLSEFGIEAVLGRYVDFINCDASFLQSDVIELLPPDRIVLEILETTVADEAILKRCTELKRKGFRLALDDFQGINSKNRGFLDLVDIIKVDIRGLSRQRLKDAMAQIMKRDALFLAEKVETKDEFNYCLDLGFNLYQGYFFSKAERVSGKRFTTAQTAIIQLLTMVQGDSDVNKIVEAFKQNPTLSVGLLRLTNSASVGLRHVVTSIQSAVVLLGHKQLQRWLLLLLMAHGSTRKGRQTVLIHQAAGRAKFMELMALSNKAWAPYSESAFITGIVSVMEALLGMETETLVESLGLMPEVRDALAERKGVLGDLLNLVEAIEQDNTSKVAELVGTKVKGGYEPLVQAQGQTIAWVNQIIDAGI